MAGRTLLDDLGTPMRLERPVRSVISLVPSITEAIATSRPELLVGATEWCSHPAELAVTRYRGTKNPDVARIIAAAPDLVVCNQEENRELDVHRLRAADIAVWVTRIEGLDDAFASLGRLFTEVLDGAQPTWLSRAEQLWSAPPRLPARHVAVPIWRDPWMVVGPRTFTSDLLHRLGVHNVFAEESEESRADQRYPRLQLAEITAAEPDLVLLPDEPYRFTEQDGPEAFDGVPTRLVSGRLLTWYGPSLEQARAELESSLSE